MDLLHNPLAEMYGPDFLLLYGVVIATTLGSCWLIVSVADPTKNLPLPLVPTEFDPYEIAYLGGANRQITQLVVFNLIQRSFLQLNKENIERSPDCPNIEQLTPLEQEILDWFTEPRTAAEIEFALPSKIEQHCQVYKQSLQNQQLLYLPEWRTAAQQASLIGGAIILSLGGYKFLAALINGHHNVAFLISMTVFAFIMLRVICYSPPRLSYLGQKYLQQLQDVFEQFNQKSKNGIPPLTSEYALLVAIFGVKALIDTPYDSYRRMFISSRSSYTTSSSGSCGSSCSSGCGSSCGSCGGCGG